MPRTPEIGIALALALGVLAAPLPAQAQRPAKVPRAGIIVPTASPLNQHLIEAFRQGLRELGYIEGQNIAMEFPYGTERLPQLVEELINLKVDIIISVGPPVTRAAKKAGSSIPIVMIAGSGDPVAEALIASLARPGGTLTGLTAVPLELYFDKRLELLKETVPKISRVAVLWDQSMRPIGTRPLEPAGASLKIQLRELEVRSPSELEGAFKSIAREGAGAVLILESPMLFTYRTRLAELALKGRLPAISVFREFAEAGGLMTYGPSLIDQWRRAATYVDKILRGAKPADLPVEQPTRFELVINLKTANALGLTIPRSILIRADQVIQ